MEHQATAGIASGYGYPDGHVKHLSEEQEKAMHQFKAICADDGCYTPAKGNTPASHGDETLLRFLRARKFSPQDALVQFRATERWRHEQDLDEWYTTIDVDDYEQTRLLYTMWTGRRDKMGIPLYVFEIGALDTNKIANSAKSPNTAHATATQLSPKLRRLFATFEHLTNFVFPLCSSIPSRPYPETPVAQTCCIVDISGVSLFQFWNLKAHLQEASALATAHYPETLGRTFIVGAPSFFPTIWKWLKGWFDPITVSKIFVLSRSEVKSSLQQHIDVRNIPTKYGGDLDWSFGQLPSLEPEIAEIMTLSEDLTTIPMGPIRWTKSIDGTQYEARALGTVHGVRRDSIVARISADLFCDNL